MKTKVAIVCLLALLLATVLPQAYGSVSLFLNAPEDGRACGISDFGYGQQEADDFQLGVPATVTEVRWWGGYGSAPDPAASDSFLVRFFADAGGAPAVNPFLNMAVSVTRSATSLTASAWGDHDGGTVYEYVAALPLSLSASSGTTYYLSVVNNTSSKWGWSEDGIEDHWFRSVDGSSWSGSGRNTNFAFELSGAVVPVPGAFLLGLVGVALTGAVRKFRGV